MYKVIVVHNYDFCRRYIVVSRQGLCRTHSPCRCGFTIRYPEHNKHYKGQEQGIQRRHNIKCYGYQFCGITLLYRRNNDISGYCRHFLLLYGFYYTHYIKNIRTYKLSDGQDTQTGQHDTYANTDYFNNNTDSHTTIVDSSKNISDEKCHIYGCRCISPIQIILSVYIR